MAHTTLMRPASKADFPAIRRLIYRTGINPMGLAWQRFLIAVDEQDKLVGCGQVKPHKDGTLELASIAVVPERRGEGIASRIIEQLIAEHPVRLYLTCRASLGPFYKQFGFREARQEELTPYFRRIQHLVGFMMRLGLGEEGLLVMLND
jgi:N-acetylglutamate synthase-like GNAT family acetyltransferase